MKSKVLIQTTQEQMKQRDFISEKTGLQKKAIDKQAFENGLNKMVNDINRKLKRGGENE